MRLAIANLIHENVLLMVG